LKGDLSHDGARFPTCALYLQAQAMKRALSVIHPLAT